jgi:hypothetical protein
MAKRILFISHTSGIAGAELCLVELLAGIDRRKYDLIVILPGGHPFRRMAVRNIRPTVAIVTTFEEGVKRTVAWHVENRELVRQIRTDLSV